MRTVMNLVSLYGSDQGRILLHERIGKDNTVELLTISANICWALRSASAERE